MTEKLQTHSALCRHNMLDVAKELSRVAIDLHAYRITGYRKLDSAAVLLRKLADEHGVRHTGEEE